MTARTPGSPTGAPQDDAQPLEAHGDGGDAGMAGEGLSELEIERRAVFRMGERIINVVIERDDALAERDRARATAVTLEQELARLSGDIDWSISGPLDPPDRSWVHVVPISHPAAMPKPPTDTTWLKTEPVKLQPWWRI